MRQFDNSVDNSTIRFSLGGKWLELLSENADPTPVDPYRRTATNVDRILRGEKPGDLPVQFPTKFEMIVNRKTAKALGLAVPPPIRLRADDVIE